MKLVLVLASALLSLSAFAQSSPESQWKPVCSESAKSVALSKAGYGAELVDAYYVDVDATIKQYAMEVHSVIVKRGDVSSVHQIHVPARIDDMGNGRMHASCGTIYNDIVSDDPDVVSAALEMAKESRELQQNNK